MKKGMWFSRFIVGLTAALCFSASAYAEYNHLGIPDSSEIRTSIKDKWLLQDVTVLRGYNPEGRKAPNGDVFQVRMDEGLEDYSIVVAPRSYLDVNIITGDQKQTSRMEVYPTGGQGSWVLRKSKVNEEVLGIQYFFNQDSEVYLQIRPGQSKTLADLVVFGSYAARSVPVGIPFDRFYTASFAEVYRWTERTIPWNSVEVVPGQYHDVVQMALTVRNRIPSIDYAENACYNEKGELYSLATGKPFEIIDEDTGLSIGEYQENHDTDRLTLSGEGFVKWIIDGIVEPLSGKGTAIDKLQRATLEYDPIGKNGALSLKYDLNFSLNWCRNLAAEAMDIRTSHSVDWKTGGVDVNVEPFAADIVRGRVIANSGYVKNSGYAASKLKAFLYVLGVTEPGWFYLGAIRQQSKVSPDEMVFNQCAVFFPYFDDSGRFGCHVFVNDREVTLEHFMSTYRDCFVHLERVKTTDYYFPK